MTQKSCNIFIISRLFFTICFLYLQVSAPHPVMPVTGVPLVQTAVVPPLVQSQPLVQGIPPQTGVIQPLPQTFSSNVRPAQPISAPLVPGLGNQSVQPQTFQMTNSVPPSVPQPGYNAGLIQTAPVQPVVPPVPTQPVAPVQTAVQGTPRASVSSLTNMSPGSLPPSLPGSVVQSAAPSIASSTPRQSIDKGLSDMR